MNKIDEKLLLTSSHADDLDPGLWSNFSGIVLARLAAASAINNPRKTLNKVKQHTNKANLLIFPN